MNRKASAFIVVVFGLFATNALAQNATPENRLPFVYLNQYYPFSIKNDHEINLSSAAINFDKFAVANDMKTITVNLADFKILPSIRAYLISKDQRGFVADSKIEISSKKLVYIMPKRNALTAICLVQNSNFTQLEMCKKLQPTSEPDGSAKPKVTIDGADFDVSGAVVLKDFSRPVVFEAELSAINSVRLIAKKRRIFPRKVNKLEEQDFVMVQFVDLDLVKNNNWNEKISLEQTSINILLDPLLLSIQDIYFNNENLKSDALNYVYADPKKNKISNLFSKETTAEFFGMYTGLMGASAVIKAQLNSELGKGVLLSHKWRLRPSIDLFVAGILVQMTIAPEVVNPIYNANQTLYGFGGGGKYNLSESVGISAEFKLKNDLFFKRHDLTTGAVEIVTGLNKDISISPAWSFFKTENSNAQIKSSLSYLLPTTVDGVGINSGVTFGAELSYSYRINSNQIRLRGGYLKRQQSSDDFNYSEQMALYGIGYQYLF